MRWVTKCCAAGDFARLPVTPKVTTNCLLFSYLLLICLFASFPLSSVWEMLHGFLQLTKRSGFPCRRTSILRWECTWAAWLHVQGRTAPMQYSYKKDSRNIALSNCCCLLPLINVTLYSLYLLVLLVLSHVGLPHLAYCLSALLMVQ